MPSRRSPLALPFAALAAALAALALAGCTGGADVANATPDSTVADSPAADSARGARPGDVAAAAPAGGAAPDSAAAARTPNELGRVMILEYHLIGDKNARWERERGRFRQDLELLYARGYRPVTMAEFVDKKLDLPRGLSPVVFTFDDASPGQFRYVERDGRLEIDPTSMIGIWLDFAKSKPDWGNKAVMCVLTGAEAGRSLFGNKGIEGQKDEWRFRKVQFLAEQGFELCNHTLWHAQLSKYPDAFVQEQIARGVMAIDSAVPGYKVRTFALPLGLWPKTRSLAYKGSWTDPKSGRTVAYDFDAVLEVSGGPTRSIHDPKVAVPGAFNRVQVYAKELETTLDYLDKSGTRYVSDGDPRTVARPATPAAAAAAGAEGSTR